MRNYKKYYYLFWVSFILFSLSARAQNNLSFSEAQDIMYHKNTLVKAVHKSQEAYSFEEKAARGLHYPTINALGSATIMNKDVTVDLNNEKAKVAQLLQLSSPNILGNWDFILQKNNIEFAGIGFLWPVYTGGKINAAQRAAKIKSSMGENEMTNTKNKLVSELAERYFQAKLAAEALIVRKDVLEVMNQHLYDAQKLEQRGMIAETETLQAKVAVADANREVLAAAKDVKLSLAALANTLEADSLNVKLSTEFFVAQNVKPLKYYQDLAAANYPEIQKLRLQGKLVDEQITNEKADYYPHVMLAGTKVFVSNNFPLIKNPAVAGVAVTYTIFNGNQRKNKIDAASATREEVTLYREKAETDIRTLVEKLYDDLQKQNEQLESIGASLTYSKELLRVRTKAFAEGIATSVDVVDAQLHLASIELQQLNAYANYDITLAKIFEYSGISQEFSGQIH